MKNSISEDDAKVLYNRLAMRHSRLVINSERMARAMEKLLAHQCCDTWNGLTAALKAYRADVPRIEGT